MSNVFKSYIPWRKRPFEKDNFFFDIFFFFFSRKNKKLDYCTIVSHIEIEIDILILICTSSPASFWGWLLWPAPC